MITHVKVLGWLHIVFGALGVIFGLVALVFFAGIAGFVGVNEPGDARVAVPILGMIGAIAFIVMLAISIPGVIAGVGLLGMKPWARVLGIVISAIELIHVPLGTILGIYGLWVLLSAETTALFERRRQAFAAAPHAGYMK